MTELVEWLRAQLDDRERRLRERLEKPGYGPAEVRLLRLVLAEIEGTRERLDWIESKLADDPDDQTVLRMVKVEARPYADRDGYQEDWRL